MPSTSCSCPNNESEFFEQGNGTRVVLTHDGFPNESFCKTASEGTTESLDKLASMLGDQALVKHL